MSEIDSIMAELNECLKEALSGQYIQACLHIAGVTQKLVLLRKEIQNQKTTIDELKAALRESGKEVIEKEVG